MPRNAMGVPITAGLSSSTTKEQNQNPILDDELNFFVGSTDTAGISSNANPSASSNSAATAGPGSPAVAGAPAGGVGVQNAANPIAGLFSGNTLFLLLAIGIVGAGIWLIFFHKAKA